MQVHWTPVSTMLSFSNRRVTGDGKKPTCGQCRSNGRHCTPHFNVRFSQRRAWSPSKKSRVRSSSGPGSPGGLTTIETKIPDDDDTHDADAEVEETAPESAGKPSSMSTVSVFEQAMREQGYEPDPSPSNLASAVSPWSSSTPSLTNRESVLLQYFGLLAGPWWARLHALTTSKLTET